MRVRKRDTNLQVDDHPSAETQPTPSKNTVQTRCGTLQQPSQQHLMSRCNVQCSDLPARPWKQGTQPNQKTHVVKDTVSAPDRMPMGQNLITPYLPHGTVG